MTEVLCLGPSSWISRARSMVPSISQRSLAVTAHAAFMLSGGHVTERAVPCSARRRARNCWKPLQARTWTFVDCMVEYFEVPSWSFSVTSGSTKPYLRQGPSAGRAALIHVQSGLGRCGVACHGTSRIFVPHKFVRSCPVAPEVVWLDRVGIISMPDIGHLRVSGMH